MPLPDFVLYLVKAGLRAGYYILGGTFMFVMRKICQVRVMGVVIISEAASVGPVRIVKRVAFPPREPDAEVCRKNNVKDAPVFVTNACGQASGFVGQDFQ